MARITNIRLRRSSVSGNVPSTSDLDLGELAINTYDGKLYLKKNVSGTESIVEIGAGGGTGLNSAFTLYEYTATANQTTFSGSDQNSNTLSYDTGSPPKVQVYLNGVLLDWTTDFTATNGTSVVLTNGAAASDLLQVAAYKSESTVVNDLALGDNQKIKFGDDDDLEIYHDGSNSYINDVGTGDLIIKGGNDILFQDAVGNTLANMNQSNSVELYFGGSKKFETTTAGAQVTGKLFVSDTSNGLEIGASKARFKVNGDDTVIDAIPTGGGINFRTGGAVQRMHIDENGNVGIGTTSPNYPLHVVSSNNNHQIRVERTGTGNVNLGVDTTGAFVEAQSSIPLRFYESNAERMRIDGGNVGIGTTSPQDLLHLSADNPVLRLTNTTDLGKSSIEFWDNQSGTSQSGEVFFDDASNLFGLQGNANGIVFKASNTFPGSELMRLTGAGNLGIGTSSPARKFTVQGGSGDNLPVRIIGGSGTSHGSMEFQDPNTTADYKVTIGSKGDNFYIQAGGSEKVRVLSSGNVGIGTTSPSSLFHLKSGNRDLNFILADSPSTGNVGVQLRAGASDYIGLAGSGTGVGLVIDSSNNVGIGETSIDANLHITHTNPNLKFEIAGSGKWAIGMPAGQTYLAFDETNDSLTTPTMVMTKTTKRVGIGTNNPTGKLHVYDSGTDTYGTQPIAIFDYYDTDDATLRYSARIGDGATTFKTFVTSSATDFLIQDQDNQAGRLAFQVTGNAGSNQILAAESTGKVGIGTDSPQSPLHVYSGNGGTYTPNANHDDLTIEGSGNIGLQLFSPNTSYQYIAFGDPDLANAGYIRYYHGSNTMVLRTGGSDKVHILNNGDVGIGDSSPSYKLDVNGSIGADGLVVDGLTTFSSSDNATPLAIVRGSASTDQAGISFNAGGNTRYIGKGTDDEPYWATTANLTAGNKIVTASNFTGILNSTYYQANDNISVGTISSGNITTSGYLRGPSTFTIDPATHGDNTGTVVIAGNLQVDGTTTTINSTTLTVNDKIIVVADGAADATAANESGISVDGANAQILYKSTNDRWELNKEVFSASGFMIGTTSTDVGLVKNSSGVFDFQAQSARQISFSNVTNGEHMRIDANGNVGIGTSSPENLLHLASSSDYEVVFDHTAQEKFRLRHGSSGIYMSGPDTSNLAFGVDQNHDVVIFNNAGSSYATFDGSTSGLGIGTSTPYAGARMQICADDTSPSLNTTAIDDATLILSNSDDDYGTVFATQGTGVGLIQQRRMATATYYDLLLQPYGKAVGVRRTSADSNYAMHIGSPGLLVDSFSGSNGLKVYRGTELYTQIQHDSSNAFLDVGNVPHRFRVGGVDVLTLDDSTNSRNVGIGTTNPNTKLHVYDNVNRTSIKAQNNNHSAMFEAYGTATAIDSDASNGIFLRISGANKVHLDNNGNFGVNVTDPQARLQIEEYGINTTETSSTATTQIAIHTFAAATFRSARFTVQVTNSTDSTYHTTELLLVHDGTTANITEFGEIFTGSAVEATFDADINTGNVRLLATPASTDTMEFKVVAHTVTV